MIYATIDPAEKKKLSKGYTSYIQDWQLCNDNQVEVVTLALKKFDILNKIRFQGKPTSAGRKIKITTQSTRQLESLAQTYHASCYYIKTGQATVSKKRQMLSSLDFDDINQ